MAKRRIEGGRFLVTGASSGIGREIARVLSSEGARLIVTARREDRLRELVEELRASGGDAHWVAGDVTDSDDRARMIAVADEMIHGLDGLINNAGVGAVGLFADAEPDRLRRVMEVNFFAPVELTRLALPLLRAGSCPIVVNIGSVLGHRAVPKKAEYCASKFALHGFSDSLRAELAHEKIDLLHVCPSTTDSEFFDVVEGDRAAQPKIGSTPSPPRWVAQRTVRAIRKGKHEIVLTGSAKWLVWIDRLMPSLADRLVARWA